MLLKRKKRKNGSSNNGSSNGHIPEATYEMPAPIRPLDEFPDEGEPEQLPGVWDYLYGEAGKIAAAKVSRIPGHMILTICLMRLQTRLCTLTGGVGDPDLQACFESDFEELMVGLDGQGRTEAVTIASAEGMEEDEDVPSAKLFGIR